MKQSFCRKCGTENIKRDRFCYNCGTELLDNISNVETVKPSNASIDKIDNKYNQLEQKLNQLLDLSGYLIASEDNYFVQFLKEEKKSKILFNLGNSSNFDDNQLNEIRKLGFTLEGGLINKTIIFTYKEKAIQDILQDTKHIFEKIYKISSQGQFVYEGHFDSIDTTEVNDVPYLEKKSSNDNLGYYIIFGIFAILLSIGYYNKSKREADELLNEASVVQTQESTGASNNLSKQKIDPPNEEEINLNKYAGKRFTFKSTSNDHELNGETIQTINETTYHEFDFINMTVTKKSFLNGEWVSIKYPINGVYEEKGLLATTYVLTIGSLGVKEIWFSADVPNLGYDYDDGVRIACYGISKQ